MSRDNGMSLSPLLFLLFTACKAIQTDIWTHIEAIPAAHADIYCPILSKLQRHNAWSLAKEGWLEIHT